MSRGRRVLGKLAKGLAAFVVLVVVAHSILFFVNGRKVERMIEEIKAAGDPVAISDLPAANVPDHENAQLIYGEILEDASAFGKQHELVMGSGWTDLRETDPQQWNQIRQWFADAQPIIDRLEAALEGHPRCRFQLEGDTPEERFWTMSPRLAHLRQTVQFLLMNSRYQVTDGNMDEAVRRPTLACDSLLLSPMIP